jgi:hypothetical protein
MIDMYKTGSTDTSKEVLLADGQVLTEDETKRLTGKTFIWREVALRQQMGQRCAYDHGVYPSSHEVYSLVSYSRILLTFSTLRFTSK